MSIKKLIAVALPLEATNADRHTAPFPLLLPSWLDASACSPARFSREVTR